MAAAKEINHDSSTVIGDHYDTVSDPDGAITVSAGNALNGSTNGVGFDYDAGSNNIDLNEAFTLTGTDLRFRIRVDISGFTNTSFAIIFNVSLLNSSVDTICSIRLQGGGSGIVQAFALWVDDNDSSGGVGATTITGEHCLEIRMIRETGDGNDDGEIEFYIDGVSKELKADLGNFTHWNIGIDDVGVSCQSSQVSLSGLLKYDELIIDDDNTANLGCGFSGYDLVLGGGQP